MSITSRAARVSKGHVSRRGTQGAALLAVLWLSAALAAIAFSLADTVRGEAERSATDVDSLRAQQLAEGGLRRAILYLDWGRRYPAVARFKPTPFFVFDFPEGRTTVEVIPETAKINLNYAPAEELSHLLLNLGAGPARAQEVAAAIVDWRTADPAGHSPFDAFYRTLRPPYSAPHGPFQEVEELLGVKGVTPDLFYGTWRPAPPDGPQHLVRRAGLRDCLSVFGSMGQVDVNTAEPAVLATVGVPPAGVDALVRQRREQPFLTMADLAPFEEVAGAGFAHLRIGGNSIFTLRSTARVRLINGQWSDLRRTVGAQVKLMPQGYDAPYHILRWYDTLTAGQ